MPPGLFDPPESPPSPPRTIVEPPGYPVTSFVASAALTAGLGLAPVGLLLFAAGVILSVIEWRRIVVLNPWLELDDPEDFKTREGKILLRYSAWGLGLGLGISAVAFWLVRSQGNDAAVLGPALVAGVGTLVMNYMLRRAIADAGRGPGGIGTHSGDDDRASKPAKRTASAKAEGSTKDDLERLAPEDRPRADDKPLDEG